MSLSPDWPRREPKKSYYTCIVFSSTCIVFWFKNSLQGSCTVLQGPCTLQYMLQVQPCIHTENQVYTVGTTVHTGTSIFIVRVQYGSSGSMTSCFIPPGQIHTRDVCVLCLHRVTLRHKPSISCTSIPSNSLIQSSSWNTSLRLDRLVGITPHWLYLKQMLLMSLRVSKGRWASHKPWTLRPYLCLCLRTTRIWYESALLHSQSHCHTRNK